MKASKQPTLLQEPLRFRFQARSPVGCSFRPAILTISYLRYQPFSPFTMISERRFLLVLSRRLRLLIEKKNGGKGWVKRCYGKEGFSCHHLLWDLGKSRMVHPLTRLARHVATATIETRRLAISCSPFIQQKKS
jgi:hypothetical protein